VTDDATPSWAETAKRVTLAAIPYVGGALQVVYEDVRARRADKAADTITDIINATGEKALVQRLAEDPVAEALFVNAVDAAVRTGLEAKRRVLARAVAQAVTDEARLDEGLLITDVLAHLDAPHVKALKRMAVEWEEVLHKNLEDVNWGQSEVWETLPEVIRAALVRTGTAKPPRNTFTAVKGPNRQTGISDFGLELVKLLEAEGLPDR